MYRMKSFFAGAGDFVSACLDALVPRRARTMRLQSLSPESLPVRARTHELLGARIITLMNYEERTTADLIQSLKYDGSGRAARLCSSVVADYLTDELSSERLFTTKRVLLIPVPLHGARARERGFNQIELVLRCLPAEFRRGPLASLLADALERTRATKQQTRLPRSERLSNVAGAFSCPAPEKIRGARIYLIDDVATTGATLVNAATPLRRAGAEVTLLALARA